MPLDGLEPSQQDRLASPVILKPVRSGGKWMAGCLLLAEPGRADLEVELFENDTGRSQPVEWRLMPGEADRIEPLKGSETSDVLSAFMKFFDKK